MLNAAHLLPQVSLFVNTIPKQWYNNSPWRDMQQHVTTEIRLQRLQ
jgi:hypothetical protein